MSRTADRRTYLWVMLFLLVGIPFAEWMTVTFVADVEDYLKYINYGSAAAGAVFTGERLADAGFNRWLGVGGFALCGVVGPFLTFIVALFALRVQAVESFWVMLVIFGGWMIALLAFVIWAGTRPSVASPP